MNHLASDPTKYLFHYGLPPPKLPPGPKVEKIGKIKGDGLILIKSSLVGERGKKLGKMGSNYRNNIKEK